MQLNDTVNLNGIKQDMYFLGKFTANTFAANDLLRIINKYYRIAQSDIRAINEDFYGEIWRMDLQTNTGGTYPNEYSLAATKYEKIKQIQAAYNPANVAVPLDSEFKVMTMVTQDQISDPGFTFDASNPYAVIYDTQSFFVNPIPTQTVTGGLKVFTIELQADLANDTDIPNIFTDYHDVITWGALIDVGIRLGKTDLYKQATAMWQKRRQEMKDYASGRVPDIAGGVMEGQNNTGGWQYPFGSQPMS